MLYGMAPQWINANATPVKSKLRLRSVESSRHLLKAQQQLALDKRRMRIRLEHWNVYFATPVCRTLRYCRSG